MARIDLNCDMGEGFGRYAVGDDAAVLPYVTSANVACGFHAGDACVMRRTILAARGARVSVGAHPGYPDLQGFGRRAMALVPGDAYCLVQYQVAALRGMCTAAGVRLAHVKPHGALYNESARDPRLADAVAAAVADLDPALVLVGLPGSEHRHAAEAHGLRFAAEFFCDRGYRADGSLVPRGEPGDLVSDGDEAVGRTLGAVCDGVVTAVDGSEVSLRPDTVCLHGDGPRALEFARRVRTALEAEGVEVAGPAGSARFSKRGRDCRTAP